MAKIIQYSVLPQSSIHAPMQVLCLTDAGELWTCAFGETFQRWHHILPPPELSNPALRMVDPRAGTRNGRLCDICDTEQVYNAKGDVICAMGHVNNAGYRISDGPARTPSV